MRDFSTDQKQRMLSTLQYDYRKHEQTSFWATIGLVCLVMALAFGVIVAISYSIKPTHKPLVDCTGCHQRIQAYSDYFRKAGSKSPQQMAEAVLSTRNPRLMAAIAKVESGGNPDVRNTGHKKRHSGAFQVSRYHGRISHDVTEQALQAELVLTQHVTEEKGIVRGLNAYGGHRDKTNGKYAQLILAELEGVPR